MVWDVAPERDGIRCASEARTPWAVASYGRPRRVLFGTTQDGNHGNEGPTEGESPTEYVNADTYNTNIVPAGPLGDSADDVNVTPVTAPGTIPTCGIPAFGPPPAPAP
jgi:hypothetical protein